MLHCDGRAVAGRWEKDTRSVTGARGPGTSGGVLPPTARLLPLWIATVVQGYPSAAAVVGVWDGEVRAPRFLICRCAVTRRHTLNPVAEIMPDRCTPEYELIIAKMGSLLPYARARTLLAEFLPLACAFQ